jgi:uncharacterized protein (DUF2141 family)
MTLTKYLTAALLLAAGLVFTMPVVAAELQVRIEHIGETGSIHVYVFTSPEGFPKEERAVVHQVYPRPPAGENTLDVRITVPDSAAYALVSFQDKNGDGKMNRLLGMIPQEPYGLSRNPQLFGKPKFSDAAIKASDSMPIVLKLHD